MKNVFDGHDLIMEPFKVREKVFHFFFQFSAERGDSIDKLIDNEIKTMIQNFPTMIDMLDHQCKRICEN